MIANDVHAPANVPSSVRPAPEKTPYVTVNRLASRAIFHCPPSLRSIVSVQPARRTAAPPGRRHDDIEVVTQIGPVAEHLEFANIARSFNTDVAHALRHGGERLLAEWLAPQNHEHHIVRHEAQYSLQFAVCRSPAALAFIQVETRSRMAAASGDIARSPSSEEDRSSIPVRNLAVALNEPGSEHGAKSTNRKERS